MTHTPGPWTAEPTVPSEGFDCWHITSPSGDIAWAKGYHHEPEKQANARLMSAAPDLLAALEAVVSVADRQTNEFDLAHAAIAKAKGVQKMTGSDTTIYGGPAGGSMSSSSLMTAQTTTLQARVADLAASGDGCCHKTRIKGCVCPIGWECPFIKQDKSNEC